MNVKQKVVISSLNPVKIEATKMAFQKVFPDSKFEFESVSVSSNVSDQPIGNEETIRGAYNRIDNAKKEIPNADYWVGIEGGIEKTEHGMGAFAWIIIKSKDKEGKAKTGVFFLPQKVVRLVNEGKELGDANDIVFDGHNSKQKNGAVGILTKDIIDRTDFYYVTLILSLIPFMNPEIY